MFFALEASEVVGGRLSLVGCVAWERGRVVGAWFGLTVRGRFGLLVGLRLRLWLWVWLEIKRGGLLRLGLNYFLFRALDFGPGIVIGQTDLYWILRVLGRLLRNLSSEIKSHGLLRRDLGVGLSWRRLFESECLFDFEHLVCVQKGLPVHAQVKFLPCLHARHRVRPTALGSGHQVCEGVLAIEDLLLVFELAVDEELLAAGELRTEQLARDQVSGAHREPPLEILLRLLNQGADIFFVKGQHLHLLLN